MSHFVDAVICVSKMPTWRQAILWINDGYIIYAYMHHSASMIKFQSNVGNTGRSKLAKSIGIILQALGIHMQ